MFLSDTMPATIVPNTMNEKSSMEWQAIETAPKDQWVLILWESNVYQARFDSEWQWWSVAGAVDADPYSIEPTHWIEMPEDPKQIQIP